MGSTETQQKAGLPLIVKLDKGLKLAEQWINTMTKVAEDEPTEVELEARPYRLGLGAKVSRQSKVGPSNDPLERKLYAKLNNGKRKASKSAKECMLSARDGGDDDYDAEENLDSRTTAFDKKRAGASKTAFLQANKKQK
ncbi:hypothetical protein F2P56_014358 [Juglans regia]|uniref:Uncharacterized protein LOC109001482 n=2 Tax=Juglans regia TaxID=51240 RepID=A0A2I4FRQ2_JUGRE|nr:uncharacterized protein LOC109001482 [Juglans regia]XP_018834328.1 uncharacterized protein LOC109001482 [Juglans regia]XP_018834329.1 uncharacterized protein LOC109001482 [Juglans regia]XP_035547653.1 uncharacterized protein LOC109001482 [Juglans regia]KAF5464269.1 hypothetical protein F2P56_014358 [Juglans regia]